MDLFEQNILDQQPWQKEEPYATAPLAERVRPKTFSEVIGQDHLTGPDGLLRKAVENRKIPSFILWGPPGSGKTTIAQIVARESGLHFVPFSAVLSGIKEVRYMMTDAGRVLRNTGKQTVIFIDEIHRFNKAQQDAFLPFVEKGQIILIGATTENPSFEINSALISRMHVYTVNGLSAQDQVNVLKQAMVREPGLFPEGTEVPEDHLRYLVSRVPADARAAINLLEAVSHLLPRKENVTKELIDKANQRVSLLYDKAGEEHYNIISALHKSLRNSDVDAGLYWLARMLESGEDPLYVARRLIRFASEDIGNADPQALILAIAAKDTVHFLGLPEAKLALAQLVIYLATSPKSNSVYSAYSRVEGDLKAGHVYPVPLQIRNAPTKLMKDIVYGKDYEYAHHSDERTTAMSCMPDEIQNHQYYHPVEIGFEKEIKRRKEYFEKIREKLKNRKKTD